MTEKRFRNTVIWMSFLFTILVIWAHSYNAELFLGEAGVRSAVGHLEGFLGDAAAQIAVPGFFMISSVLFFRNYEPEKTGEKWLRRGRSLLIPYLLWNAVYFAVYAIGSRIPGLSGVVGKGVIPLDPKTVLYAVGLYEYNYVFWYVFQLLLLTLLSPIVYMAALYTPVTALILFILSLLIALRLNFTPLNADALFYYLTAAWITVQMRREILARKREARLKRMRSARKRIAWIITGPLWGPVLLAAAAVFHHIALFTENDLPTVLCRLFGAAAVWCILSQFRLPEPAPLMRETFLIYAVHFAPVRFINKTANLILHGSTAGAAVLFLFMPVLILLFTRALIKAGKRFCPVLLGLMSGGRL